MPEQCEKLAFVFPGQGSQSIGMLADLESEARVVATFAEASEAIELDLWELAQKGPEEQQNLTANTQPLILTASVALWRLWCDSTQLRPAIMAGHSLGEFSALVCAGVIGFSDAVRLVQKRGEYMQNAVPVGTGSMAAIIGLSDEEVNTVCAEHSGEQCVCAVNFNAPGQVVIAGHSGAVDAAIEGCKSAGAKRAMRLPVSAPFHTPLMEPAGQRLQEDLQQLSLSPPQIPVVHNVHCQTEAQPQKIKQLLVEQISSPVPWVRCVEQLQAAGVQQIAECGPGKVLSGLNKRISRAMPVTALHNRDSMNELISHPGDLSS